MTTLEVHFADFLLHLGVEKATNPFLRAAEPALARAVKMEPGSDPAAVFVALREWKNAF